MNRADLIDRIAGACKISRARATSVVDATVESVTAALKKGDRVALSGFGTFSVSQRKARNGRNPQTGATIKIAARRVAKFTPGIKLKKAITFRRKTSASEVRRSIRKLVDSRFRNNFMDGHSRERILRAMDKHLSHLVRDFNHSGQAILDLGLDAPDLKILMRDGHNPSSASIFNIFHIEWPRKKPYKKLRCFLGCRFLPKVVESLTMNLRHILEPSGIDLEWSGMDLVGVSFLDDIIDRIRDCDFCIFDNRLATNKPNVYIEVGIAYAFGKPFILANYGGKSGRIPSDLKQVVNIDYKNYKGLCSMLQQNLPAFLDTVGLRESTLSRNAN